MENQIQKVVAVVTIIFFIALALVLVIGGWTVIFPGSTPATDTSCVPCKIPDAPRAPDAPTTTDTAAYTQQTTAYQHRVTAYQHQVTAYEKYLAAWSAKQSKESDRQTRYQAVVKDALLPVLNPLVLAFIAYAFVKGTTNVVQNVLAARKPEAPLKTLDM